MRSVIDFSAQDTALATAAGTVAATIRQHQIGGERSKQHRVAIRATERVIAGLYGNLHWHEKQDSNRHRSRLDGSRASMIRVLLIGCGDIALRTADLLRSKVRLYGLTRRADDIPRLRAHSILPIVGDLDRLSTLRRLRAAPFAILHFAPPPSEGRDDPRTQRLIAALARARSI